jgi:hypothetical protein
MEPKGSLLLLEVLATCSCPQPDQSTPYLSLFWKICCNIVLPCISNLQNGLLPSCLLTKNAVCTSCLPYCIYYTSPLPSTHQKIEYSLNKRLQTWNFQNHFCHTQLTSFHILQYTLSELKFYYMGTANLNILYSWVNSRTLP